MPKLETCERCRMERELVARVRSEILDLKVCAFCAREAAELRLTVEALDDEK